MSVGHNIMDCFCLSIGIKTDIMLLSLFSGLYSPPRTLSTVLRSAASKCTRMLRGTRCISSSLEDRLKIHFNNVMKRDNVPLLSSFDEYKSRCQLGKLL